MSMTESINATESFNHKSLRVLYAGTPDFAVPALRRLIHSRHKVCAVYTQPDRRAGRGRKLRPSAVKKVALEENIPVLQPVSLKDAEAQTELADWQADIMIVAAYGLILPQTVLETPRYGCLNIHGSLLPRWRGAAPIHRAIQAGDTVTGVTIMQMDAGLDTGDILYKTECPITDKDTTADIHDCLAEQGAEALLSTLDVLCEQGLQPEKQEDALACYAHKLSKAEADIDWTQAAVDIQRNIRALNPFPVAWTTLNGKALRFFNADVLPQEQAEPHIAAALAQAQPGEVIHESREGIHVASGDGVVRISELQWPGSKRTSAANFLNARSLLGSRFEYQGVVS